MNLYKCPLLDFCGIEPFDPDCDTPETIKAQIKRIKENIQKKREGLKLGRLTTPGVNRLAIGYIDSGGKGWVGSEEWVKLYMEFQKSLPEDLRDFSEQLTPVDGVYSFNTGEYTNEYWVSTLTPKEKEPFGSIPQDKFWLKVVDVADRFSAFLQGQPQATTKV